VREGFRERKGGGEKGIFFEESRKMSKERERERERETKLTYFCFAQLVYELLAIRLNIQVFHKLLFIFTQLLPKWRRAIDGKPASAHCRG
jgi:hypothetical protein